MSAGDEVKVFDAHISDGKGFWGCFAQLAFIKWLKFISPCCVVLDNCLLILLVSVVVRGSFLRMFGGPNDLSRVWNESLSCNFCDLTHGRIRHVPPWLYLLFGHILFFIIVIGKINSDVNIYLIALFRKFSMLFYFLLRKIFGTFFLLRQIFIFYLD